MTKTNKEFMSLYDVLEKALKGKEVRLRSYGHRLPDYDDFEHDKKDNITKWSDKSEFIEWTGTVKKILFNDSSHVDIIFDEKKPRTCSNKKAYKDCFGWH